MNVRCNVCDVAEVPRPGDVCDRCGLLQTALIDRTALLQAAAADAEDRSFSRAGTLAQPSSPQRGPAEPWPTGFEVAEFVIVEKLGEGGMGEVYLAEHPTTKLRLAVKRTRVTDPVQRSMFLTELQTWLDLPPHPHLVPCRFFRTLDDGGLAIFADFVDGGSLQSWIESGQVCDLSQMLDIAIQIAWGLDAAHRVGIVHRDIKPANVMMSRSGTARITDFGLAAAHGVGTGADDEVWTRVSKMVQMPTAALSADISVPSESGGMTPAYASPEQAMRQPLSRRTDIFSWATCLMEMLTGDIAWGIGPFARAYLNRLDKDLLPGMRPLPERMLDVLSQALADNPRERFAAMAHAADELAVLYEQVAGRRYPRELPFVATPTPVGVLARCTSWGQHWEDPAVWVPVAGASTSIIDVERSAATTRRAQAAADLAVYDRLAGRIRAAGLDDTTSGTFFRQKAYIHQALDDLRGAQDALHEAAARLGRAADRGGDVLAVARLETEAALLAHSRKSWTELTNCRERALIFSHDQRVGEDATSVAIAAACRANVERLFAMMTWHTDRSAARRMLPAIEDDIMRAVRPGDLRPGDPEHRGPIVWVSAAARTVAYIHEDTEAAHLALTRARPLLEAARRLAPDDVGLAAETARYFSTLAVIHRRGGRHEECLAAYGSAEEVARDLTTTKGRDDIEHELSVLLMNKGIALRRLWRLDEAEAAYAEAAQMRGRMTFGRGRSDMMAELAHTQALRATLAIFVGQPQVARAMTERVLGIRTALAEGGDGRFRRLVAKSRVELVRCAVMMQKPTEALDMAREARPDVDVARDGGVASAALLAQYSAEALWDLGRYDACREAAGQAQAHLFTLLGEGVAGELDYLKSGALLEAAEIARGAAPGSLRDVETLLDDAALEEGNRARFDLEIHVWLAEAHRVCGGSSSVTSGSTAPAVTGSLSSLTSASLVQAVKYSERAKGLGRDLQTTPQKARTNVWLARALMTRGSALSQLGLPGAESDLDEAIELLSELLADGAAHLRPSLAVATAERAAHFARAGRLDLARREAEIAGPALLAPEVDRDRVDVIRAWTFVAGVVRMPSRG